MAKMPEFPFDPAQITAFFQNNDLSKYFPNVTMPDADPKALMEAQKKNMDALVEANKAAAAGYQDLFKKQLSVFEETMTEARKQVENFDASKMTPDAAKEQGEYVKAAFEKAIANMTVLAEEAQKANTTAYKAVSGRVEESMKEIQDLAKKFTA